MRILIAAAAALLSVGVSGQTRPADKASIETQHLTLSSSIGAVTGGPDGKISLIVDVAPKPKMHVYAPGERDGIPVSLAVEPGASFKAGAAVFPAAEKFFFEPLKLTQLVYSKPFRITLPLTFVAVRGSQIASRETQVGGPLQNAEPLTITATFRYQACDDKVCYLPKSVPLTWRVERK